MRRCAEIVMLSKLNHGDAAQVKEYRLWVKKRIYLQNKEALEDFEKQVRIEKLDETYRALVGDYQELVERL
jgi:histone acetyltransferase 1